MTSNISFTINLNTLMSSITTPTSINSTTLGRNLLYGDNCTEHEECTLTKNLFCEYEFDFNQKHCFCETTYFWNKNSEQCGENLSYLFFSSLSFYAFQSQKRILMNVSIIRF
jgi:hypothetical protein